MASWCLHIVVFVFFILLCHCYATKVLKQAHVLYRHGDRTPVGTYPTDEYQESFWPDGFGRLTQIGMRMEYELGMFLKNRYITNKKFINESYLHKQVFCKSSDAERCLMSAESQMAGLYPPKGWQVWNKSISWQPVPVHTVPGDQDPYLRPWDAHCQRLNDLVAAKQKQKEFIEKEVANKDLIDKLKTLTGLTDLNVRSIWRIRDTLYVESCHGLPKPKWLTDKMYKRINDLYFWGFKFIFTGDNEFSRLSGGPLLKWINLNMDAMKNKMPGIFKLNIYSAHDTTILALLGTLGLYYGEDIPYASAVIVELYENTPGIFTVEMYYRNSTKVPPAQLQLTNCDKECPLDKFKSLLNNRVPSDYDKECGKVKKTTIVKKNMSLVIGLAILSGILLLIVIAILIQQNLEGRKMKGNQYIAADMRPLPDTDDEGGEQNLLSA
eukprot:Seg14.4 transcript_id=Seg14.4/GoldUCD/mRNA.D3Y31 product="Lysosomal acid phosphatase" protein_id=Seg14.4/GoldUCD/D3Y31